MAPPSKYQNIDLYDKSVLHRYFVVLSAVTDLFSTRNITTFPRTLASKLTGQPEESSRAGPRMVNMGTITKLIRKAQYLMAELFTSSSVSIPEDNLYVVNLVRAME